MLPLTHLALCRVLCSTTNFRPVEDTVLEDLDDRGYDHVQSRRPEAADRVGLHGRWTAIGSGDGMHTTAICVLEGRYMTLKLHYEGLHVLSKRRTS